ncbi:Inositol-1,4,5-trisphosphate 5-phosphatase 1 [Recurvomyces mirabilis]|uniref:phosphoinositide 5-phosphatase n=1 Tax=Recurvomyces mirabilis TaxID=574656 RepID=A0AAE0WT38_9PEZI|nr:Inositol-1,4,5-trisphosphate 5-phosphatase 1 [Recurvomyces mirabilis]KAK5157303.1 Inositol-1,4,5-trisphosphate 5-phosphatase 1 [Recurvomyces mirabilis]
MKLFIRDQPRALALATDTHVLILRHSPSNSALTLHKTASSTSVGESGTPRCIVEFSPWEAQDMSEYRSLSSLKVQGTLGLVTLERDVFLCVVNGSSHVATVRPGETVQRILSVEFHCLTRSDFDHLLNEQINPFPTDDLDAGGHDHGRNQEPLLEHPCMALKKLLSGGSFYYSADFDLTKRLQDRPPEGSTVAIDSLDAGFLWNTFMIQPLVEFRSRLSEREKEALDQSKILTSAIRGFASTVTVPASSSPARMRAAGFPSNMTLISRLSCRRAGTRFNARGIDDDGNVANFVETETIFCTDTICFSYVQIRGSVPMFWEQASGLPGQQKITITRSADATQPAFDKHFEHISKAYGDIFVVNLLSDEKSQEVQITRQYLYHIEHSLLNQNAKHLGDSSEHLHLKHFNYDFHAQTRGPNGYEAASGIRRWIEQSAVSFEHFLSEEAQEIVQRDGRKQSIVGQNVVLEQSDRTNLIQTIISQMAVEIFLRQQDERSPTSDFWARHGTLWADCGDALSKIYAGTGALKSSFTRSGKMSFAGALADVRKSAQRLYINNFEDKGRQNTIDMLLGRLIGQIPVHLYDPINDWVTAELAKRQSEYSSSEQISIFVGTFNLNGKTAGPEDDLSLWLCPDAVQSSPLADIVAIAFQEIVELDVQQIMSTDPHRRQVWEEAVRKTLNVNSRHRGSDEYVMLRGGQLVGASLAVYVKANVLPLVKNVEGAVKKTGMSGMAGNKGAVAIRMEYAETSICLVTAHLAAGFANYEERNQDYRTISAGLHFQRNRTIEDHDTIIWAGDFNYRIGMDNERARLLIKKGDLGQLYENDQLNLQMVHGKTFPFYTEKTPKFLPTYKYNLYTDEYDSSEKARIPAWCDRIVTKGDNLRQMHYDTATLRFSDHRPVYGYFQCTINVSDRNTKDKISAELYAKRRADIGNRSATQGDESDVESLIGYESIEPGLPPASSDKRKWWLDNGMPARSTVKPPAENGYVPNPARPSNPFSPATEPDWVKVEKPSAPPSRTASRASNISQTSRAGGEAIPARKLAPSPGTSGLSNEEMAPPPRPPRPATFNNDDGKVHMKQTLRKPAPPPKPSKPALLRSETGESTASSVGSSRAPPPAPEPRRVLSKAPTMPGTGDAQPSRVASGASFVSARSQQPPQPPPSRTLKKAVPDSTPSLPSRRDTSGLMDQGGDGGDMKGWEPLKPL